MSGFSAFVLTTTGSNILFRSIPKTKLFNNSASLSLVGGSNSLAHKLRVIAAVKLYLNAAYAQHLALKPVYEKRHYLRNNEW